MTIRPAGAACLVGLLALVATLAAALAADPAAAEPVKNPTNVDINGLKGTHGVDAIVYSSGHTVAFQARKGHAYAEYHNAGAVTGKRVTVGYGPYGSVDVRFHARKIERCHGKPFLETGVFKGTIKFRGDHGFTRVKTHRAKGVVSSVGAAMPCQSARRRLGGGKQKTTTTLGASRENVRLTAYRTGGPKGTERPFINASEGETKHGIDISRGSSVYGPPHSFTFNWALTKATLTPQLPFSGSGSFDSDAIDPLDAWTGNLRLNVLGAPDVRLAGQGFAATLSSDPPKAGAAQLRTFGR